MSKIRKVSRRDFARTSVAAGAAAVGLPGALLGKTPMEKTPAAAAGTAAAVRRRLAFPPELMYGGMSSDGRHMTLDETLTPAGEIAPNYPGGWKEGTTIPAEYYIEEKHYLNDERFLKEHFWFMVDHESRIQKPGDYFVFEFGRSDSVIIVRDQSGTVRAYHNVCRHRGSRLCLHEFDNVRPSEARADGKPPDTKFSVVQLGSSGNSPVFRCPYHAWTYDLSGKLVSFPQGMPGEFDPMRHGLRPVHAQTCEGFIFVSFAQEPPNFDAWAANWRNVHKAYGSAQLKVAARRKAPTKGNWKLVIENFRECYHCQPAHRRTFITAHWVGDLTLTHEQVVRMEQEIARHGHVGSQDPNYQRQQGRDQLAEPAGSGMTAGGQRDTRYSHLRAGYLTASLDGKPVAPLLPGRKEWTHIRGGVTTGFSTSFSACYDDHVMALRFTPRDVMSTDVDVIWLVHPEAKEGKDYDVEHLIGLWYNTYREDRWVVENNHHGIMTSGYAGGQPYSLNEGGPAGFVKWYMREVAARTSETQTGAV